MSDLLPPNATAPECALSEATARVGYVPTPGRSVWDPNTCPSSLLPWLAWAFSVDQWSSDWSDAQKRATIASAVAVHRYKGTIGAVRDSIAALGVTGLVQEWFAQSPAGAPYTFRLLLEVDQAGVDQLTMAKLLDVVDSSKNLRSHLDTIVPGVTTESDVSIGGVTGIGNEISVQFCGNLLSDGAAISDGHYKSNALKLD